MTDNLELWNSVCKTNPKHTKPVTFGRQFTAICPQSQIMAATDKFGPMGTGWGATSEISYPPNETVIVKVTIWYERKDQIVEQYGGCDLYLRKDGKIKGPDTDALKKAFTDGLTKGLSWLGFNADIFLGMYDDNKYIQEVANEIKAKEEAERKAKTPPAKKLKGPLNNEKLTEEVKSLLMDLKIIEQEGGNSQLESRIKKAKAVISQLEKDAPKWLKQVNDCIDLAKKGIADRDEFPGDMP